MRSSSVFVSLSRGGTVEFSDLADALKNKKIRGAAVDAFDEEPLEKDSFVWDIPNLIVTPHIAGYFCGSHQAAIEKVRANVRFAVFNKRSDESEVNLAKGY
jgi:phosphoglycerate dehydrogenase-like enzyme